MYSEQQLVKVIEEQDLKPKTLEQQEPNSSFDVSVAQNTSGLTFTPRYCKALVINNVLYIVMSYVLENETAASIGASNIQFEIQFDAKTGSNIICTNGKSLNDPDAETEQVCSFRIAYGTTFSSQVNTYMFRSGLNKLAFWISSGAAIAAGASSQYEGRVFLALL